MRTGSVKRFGKAIDSLGIGFILILLCILFSTQSEIFLTRSNFTNILIQTAVNITIATGMTFVIGAGEIDLSVGSLLAVCSVLTAMILRIDPASGQNIPMFVADGLTGSTPESAVWAILWWIAAGGSFLFLALLPGVLAGGLAGTIVVRLGVPSFIVTLGLMMIYRGFARYLTDAAPVTGMPPGFMDVGAGTWFAIGGFRVTYSSVIALAIALGGATLLAWSRFGRYVLAIGGNRQAAFLSGVPVRRTRLLVFVMSGVCVSIAAVVQTSRLFIGDPNAGEGYELNAIAAVIIGGTSLFGGKASVVGTLFAALIIGVLGNGLDLMAVTNHIKQIVIGAMIIFAVLLDYYRRRLYRSTDEE